MVTVGVREGVTEAGDRAVVKDRTAALTREGAPKLGSEGEVGKEAWESPTWHPALLSETADPWAHDPQGPTPAWRQQAVSWTLPFQHTAGDGGPLGLD